MAVSSAKSSTVDFTCSGGFVYLDELVRRIPCTVQWVHHLVATDAKNRFALWADEVGRHTIRANQGHSIDKPQSGTCFVRGPSCHPWHNNVRMEAHPASGIRNSSEVLIYVHARTALEAGLKFYRSQNNVILSPGDKQGIIPSCYFSQVVHRFSEKKASSRDKVGGLTVERLMYEKEAEQEQARYDKKKANGADEYELRKQQEVIMESKAMVPDTRSRLVKACDDLQRTIGDETDLAENEDYKAALKHLQEAKQYIE